MLLLVALNLGVDPAAACSSVSIVVPFGWTLPLDGQTDVPPAGVIRVLGHRETSPLPEEVFNVVRDDGVVEPGETTQEATQAVFRPDALLLPGRTYTVTYGDLQPWAFTVEDREIVPPSGPPSTKGLRIEESTLRDDACDLFSPTTRWHRLQGMPAEATSTDDSGSFALLHVVRLSDGEDASLDPTYTNGFGDSEMWGPAWEHTAAHGSSGEECVRLIEEDAAGNRSEPSEVACLEVERACNAGGGGSGLFGVLIAAAGLMRRRAAETSRA